MTNKIIKMINKKHIIKINYDICFKIRVIFFDHIDTFIKRSVWVKINMTY